MKFHQAVQTIVPTRVHRAVQARVHRAVQPKVLHTKGEGYVMCARVNIITIMCSVYVLISIYMYMTIIILYSTPPDKCGAYVEEGPWFDSERQGCP